MTVVEWLYLRVICPLRDRWRWLAYKRPLDHTYPQPKRWR